MENLDQIQLMYVNLALLMLTSSIALYLPKRLQAAQQQTKTPKIHPEITRFYKMLNQSLQINQPKLTYIVDKIPVNDFVPFYKGLKYDHGFKIDLQANRLEHGVYSEYIVLDLASYTGPRTVEVVMHEDPPQNQTAVELYRAARRNPNFKPAQKSFGNVISLLSRKQNVEFQGNPAHKVVDLNSYRQNRVINYIPGDTEGD